jgi:hypothetical protein
VSQILPTLILFTTALWEDEFYFYVV